MDCPTCESQFTALLEGEASPVLTAARVHLDHCSRCQDGLAAFQRTLSALREVRPAPPPAGLLAAVGRTISEAGPTSRPPLVFWQPLTAGLAMAACFTLVMWSVLVTKPDLQAPGLATWTPSATASAPRVAAPSRGMGQSTAPAPMGARAEARPAPGSPIVATARREASPPAFGAWASGTDAAPPAVTAPVVVPEPPTDTGKPAGTLAASDIGLVAPVVPLHRQSGAVHLTFTPPAERTVGVPVVGELRIQSEAEGEATVRIQGRRGLRIENAPEGLLYQGPVHRGADLKLPLKLVASRAGTQRLRITLQADVPIGVADLDIAVPGFTGETSQVGLAPVHMRFRNTPVARAIRQMAAEVGARVVIHDGVSDERITQDYSAGVPFAAALRIMCESTGCRVEERSGVYHIVR